jgi:hypothetical protein
MRQRYDERLRRRYDEFRSTKYHIQVCPTRQILSILQTYKGYGPSLLELCQEFDHEGWRLNHERPSQDMEVYKALQGRENENLQSELTLSWPLWTKQKWQGRCFSFEFYVLVLIFIKYWIWILYKS